MAIVYRLFRYLDGREERTEPFDAWDEHYGVGELCEHHGILWRAIDSHVPDPIDDPNGVELVFVSND
jgi:hypothetical protein